MSGCIANLDSGEYPIFSYNVIDDFRQVCRIANFQFFSKNHLDFTNDESVWITDMNSDWVAYDIDETYNDNMWGYKITCVPKGALTVVNKTLKSTKDIANLIGTSLSDMSISIDVPINMINTNVMNFCARVRNQSLLLNADDVSKSTFIYFDNTVMVSTTLKTLIEGESEHYQNVSNLQEEVIFYDSRMKRLHEMDTLNPSEKKAKHILNSLIGRTICIKSSTPSQLFKSYTIDLQDRVLPRMVCINVETNSKTIPQVYFNTFAEILL